jgi:hypothetical protein
LGEEKMISLRKLVDPRSPQKVCMRAYELFLEGGTSGAIVARLRNEGFTERVAARAVTFLASAFARVHYEREGLTFPEHFYPGFVAYKKGTFLRYLDEPIFQAAMHFARQLRRDGDWSQVWRFIEISAEHRGIAEARARGLTPVCTSLVIHEF